MNNLTAEQLRAIDVQIAVARGGTQEEVVALGRAYLLWNVPGRESLEINPPHYTTDITAASPLLLEMNEQEPSHKEPMYPVIHGCGVHGWRVQIFHDHHDGAGEVANVLAPTLELAICLAWLEWQGVKVEGENG